MNDWVSDAGAMYAVLAGMIDDGEDLDEVEPVRLHNLYLVASLLYYHRDFSIMRDESYDRVCRYLLLHYGVFKDVVWWPEKYLDKEALEAGTAFDLEYPAPIGDIATSAMHFALAH